MTVGKLEGNSLEMSCWSVQEQLEAYVGGALSGTERFGVECHLRTCAVCREELALERGLSGMMESFSTATAPADFAGGVVATWEGKREKLRQSPWADYRAAVSEFTFRTLVDPLLWTEYQFQSVFDSLRRQLMSPLQAVRAPFAGVTGGALRTVFSSLKAAYKLTTAPLAGGA
jgi:hypothetical protein